MGGLHHGSSKISRLHEQLKAGFPKRFLTGDPTGREYSTKRSYSEKQGGRGLTRREELNKGGKDHADHLRLSRKESHMMVYKVFYKDYDRKIGVPLGRLIERRKNLRGMTPLEAGMRWAKVSYGSKVKTKQNIFVVPEKV